MPQDWVDATPGPLKKRVEVSYGKGDVLRVLIDRKPLVLLVPLFAPVDPSGCSWTIDGTDVVVTMEKRDAKEWNTIFLTRTA